MRPDILNYFFKAITSLKGVGPKVAQNITRLVGRHVEPAQIARYVDLLFHLPMGYKDRRNRPKVEQLEAEQYATLKLQIGKHIVPPRHNKRIPYRINCYDDTGEITLSFFRARGDYLKTTLPEGELRYIGGKIEEYNGNLQINHPDFIATEDEMKTLPVFEPIYPMTAGLAPKTLRKTIAQLVQELPKLPEWLDKPLIDREKWPTFNASISGLHLADKPEIIDGNSPHRQRIAFDEIFANQLVLALTRKHVVAVNGNAINGTAKLVNQLVDLLPYTLTNAQQDSFAEIKTDMAAVQRMVRLLQGDVGSGKTVVALMAMLTAVEAGYQAAIMAPTEILARQHGEFMQPLCARMGIEVEILTGRNKGKNRAEILQRLASGQIDILIGTHALFQADIVFDKLGLAIIDEQHRFGVHQRLALQNKGLKTDLLVMTATPIPRTLVLTNYGDMSVSKLTEKPAGRKPIKTVAMPLEKLGDILLAAARAIDTGQRIYWICPLVEESEILPLSNVEDRFAMLNNQHPGKVGLVHGRMAATEKDEVMQKFQTGEISILVATTVVEVGVNVPEATIMIIEHAERFGLSQLHQLRGRVGRSDAQSSCILLYGAPLGATASERLKIMRQTEDGFLISEKDLELRGGGDLLGAQQSGDIKMRLADVENQADLIEIAHKQARLIVETDPRLEKDKHKNLRTLLYLFDRDQAIKLLSAG
ncbi:MAG: ATP-dependent DNA helicase RecG [Rhizobiales bacterium]|nr:ATP-dependent DNA helicase RecG [Hyphomicrobiales bacterium]NRB14802.1 ATP-dependent DNA helicase RecG [Hyphomicrobiales bacterium]